MNFLKYYGLKKKGLYCFYCVSPDTAVLVGLKRGRDGKLVVPERIGKFTVRGVSLAPGNSSIAHDALSEKKRIAMWRKLHQYVKAVSIPLTDLPPTVEYVGNSIGKKTYYGDLHVPSHIRYIEGIGVDGYKTLTLPNSLLYLGHVSGRDILGVRFEGEESLTPPYHKLSTYLGREVEDVPQIGIGAFKFCENLWEVILGDHFVKIGKDAMPQLTQANSENLPYKYFPSKYHLHIPKQLQSVDEYEFRKANIDTLIYPDDLSETLRRKSIYVEQIQHLIIRDVGQLKQYTELKAQGLAPEEHPEKCLYYLMRRSAHIYFATPMQEIFDGMFNGCSGLYSICMGSESTDNNLQGFKVPEGIRYIGKDAFSGCKLLKPIQFCEGLEHIGEGAFANCCNLSSFNIPASLQYLGADAFKNCKQLRLTPDVLQRLQAFPDAYETMKSQWAKQVDAYIEAGDKKLSQDPRSVEHRQEAYRQYCKALEIDPFKLWALQKIEMVLLDPKVGSGVSVFGLNKLRTYLLEQNSMDLVNYLDDYIFEELDAVSTIIFCGDELRDIWRSYCLNANQEAAVEIMSFLFECIDEHPNVGDAVKHQMKMYLGSIAVSPTRNNTPETTREFQKLCNKVSAYCGWKHQCRPVTEEYHTITKLTPATMMEEYKKALQETNVETSYYNAEFWLDMAKKFNPKMKIPYEFTNLKLRFDSAQKQKSYKPVGMPDFTFTPSSTGYTGYNTWDFSDTYQSFDTYRSTDTYGSSDTFSLPDPPSSGPYLDEDDRILREIASDSSGYMPDNFSWGQAAIDLENDWLDLDDLGFWDDKSWQ